jgi:hypothetical protein
MKNSNSEQAIEKIKILPDGTIFCPSFAIKNIFGIPNALYL